LGFRYLGCVRKVWRNIGFANVIPLSKAPMTMNEATRTSSS
jgi:hypothetical protein